MKKFKHTNVSSFEEASKLLASGKDNHVIAGGTDLMGVLKTDILKETPDTVINLKTIPHADYIEDKGNVIAIGAMAKLCDIEKSEAILKSMPAVAQAAHSIATPLIRNQATIGGNLCQDVRCWFYRYPDSVGGRLDCMRKGGEQCYAIHGENRYHSIFGGMHVKTTPCTSECPAGTNIPAYMEQIRLDNWEKAADIFIQYNPMPMMTSRICPHPCQDKCNQCSHGEPVNIHGVERSLGDYILQHTDRYYPAPEKETGKKVAVVGAGPGGLTAAYYLRKAGNEVVVYDMMEKPGGVLRYGIPHYRLPKHFIDEYCAAIEKMGVQFKMGVKMGEDFTLDDLDRDYDAIYMGTGAWRQPMLGLDGENLTEFGLDFLKDVNTYLEKTIGEEVLVCGGGNVAMDVALTACRLGAKKVRLVCLETRDTMPATEEEIQMCEEEGVEIYGGWGLGKVLTDEKGHVCGLESMKCTAVRDENGRFNPQYDFDTKRTFESDYIILATGQGVDVSFLGEKFSDQLTSERGLIEADAETGKTSNPKIYAGGDSVTGPNIAIRAIRTGRNAARHINADFGLEAENWITQDGFIHFDKDRVGEKEKTAIPQLPVGERTLTAEDTASYSDEAVAREAGRCMNCGCYSVNASDLSPVLVALRAVLNTNKRSIDAASFFTTKLKAYDMLEVGELITGIEIPKMEGYVSGYEKFRLREAIDFAIASVAYAYKVTDGVIEDARVVLGGVAPVPLELIEVEDFLKGKAVSDDLAAEAAALAVKDADPLQYNAYKVNEVQALVRRSFSGLK